MFSSYSTGKIDSWKVSDEQETENINNENLVFFRFLFLTIKKIVQKVLGGKLIGN